MKRLTGYTSRIFVGCVLAILALGLVPITSHAPLSASSDPNISLTSSAQVSFPTALTFKVAARSDVKVVDLRLHYVVERQNYAEVVSEGWPQFTPSTSIDTQWVWDMRKSGGLPPGTQVEYWWTAQDAQGDNGATSVSTVSFDDDRYDWQSVSVDPVTLLWYNGDQSFADTLMNSAQQGLKRIENDTGAVPQGQVHIYIYASAQDLQSAELFPQTWEGGVTFEGYDVIAIGVSPSQLAFGERAVPHELTHWIVGQITFNDYGAGLPTWLDEGLATYGEGSLNPDYASALNTAIHNHELISVRTLSSPFSAIAEEALLSYGESNSIVTFLIQRYGRDEMNQLLQVFHQGSTYDDALKQVYGFDQDGLDTIWKQSLGVETSYMPQPELVLSATPA
jgi:hypothetical protein